MCSSAHGVLHGLAAAIMTPTALSIITTMFKEGPERNKALGAWSSAGGIGGTAGALLGGPLTDGPGRGWIFFVNIPVALVMVALSPALLKESYDRGRARTFDLGGAVTSTAAMVLIVYAIVDAPQRGWDSGRSIGVFVVAAVLLALFVGIERRSAAPLVPLHHFRPRPVAVTSLLLLAVACLTLTQVRADGNYVSNFLLGMVLFGPGLGAGFVAGSIASLTGVADRDAGLASGLNNAAFHVGGALGIAILATVAVSHARGPNPAVAMTAGFQAAFGVAIVFAAVGVLAALALLGRPRAVAPVAKPAAVPVTAS